MVRPAAVVLEVFETIFPLEGLRPRLASLGLAGDLDLFFTRVTRDALALDATGSFAAFRDVASGALAVLAAQRGLDPDRAAIEAVLDGLRTLDPHPDVRPALARLRGAGLAVATLSNGGVDATRKLLARAGLLDLVAKVTGADEVRRFEPAREVYLHAAAALGVPPGRVAMISVQAWALEGARRAGLVTAWASRLERRWHPSLPQPDVSGADLVAVAEQLASL